jgi:glycerate kinase
MALKVLIVPDKFKGTLNARAAAEAMARGWRRARRGDRLELLSMSDGGDGFGEVLGGLLRGKVQRVRTVDAAHRPCIVRWWWEPKSRTAILESALAIGLAGLPPGQFHPFELDTFGLGALVRAAAAKGARRCLMGIGGSATNDGGFGLARALGWEFFDRNGQPIERWTGLGGLHRIGIPSRRRWFEELLVAVDVRNPLLGARGATRIYGPQKGLRAADFAPAERSLRRMARVTGEEFQRDFSSEPGAGAAGGLGFGLRAFLGAKLKPGFDLFAHYAALDSRLRSSDLVITGEGAIDHSTLMGKGAGQIARCSRKLGIPCIGLGGAVTAGTKARSVFTQTHALTELATVEEAKANPRPWLERLAQIAARELPGENL